MQNIDLVCTFSLPHRPGLLASSFSTHHFTDRYIWVSLIPQLYPSARDLALILPGLVLSYGHAMASIPFSLFSEPVGTTSPLRRLTCCSERCRKQRLSLPPIPLFWLHLGPIGHNLFSSNVQYLCIFIRRGFIPLIQKFLDIDISVLAKDLILHYSIDTDFSSFPFLSVFFHSILL